ncbi:FAD-binding oxidoreductase [Saccharopolyspora sp. ASAGF58]|uniref:NAD(P)/FAD-dependent oxidoreductase n=1 Tax=Saccharopolyspora sp. ASAGF58 TaxID=2719023 RepID=UPI001440142F|nr:FAD-dependent oxidoreductase [Saccharopolyspora sp. ASAGF58]QIZ38567.1 FAD-dependent oxidoreductase [Saccharopolyspora sp. ASAGF58]
MGRPLAVDASRRPRSAAHHGAVYRLARAGGTWRLETRDATITADRVVVAAGAWSPSVVAGLGVRLPVQSARGCSLTSAGSGTPPRRAVKLLEAQVACSPVDGAVRLSGTFDLTRADARLSPRRLPAVLRAAQPYFREWQPDLTRGIAWSGLRPATPDGLPFVGPVPGHGGLFVATGHGTLGITLAPVTACAVRDMVIFDRLPDAFTACAVDRFERTRHR